MNEDPENMGVLAKPTDLIPSIDQLPSWWTAAYGSQAFRTSIAQSKSAADRALLMKCLNEEGEPAIKWINRDFGIVHVTFYPVSYTNDAGELAEYVGWKLVTSDGSIIAGGARGVVKSLMIFAQCGLEPPYNPPLRVRLESLPTKNGKHRYLLRDLSNEVTVQMAKKKS